MNYYDKINWKNRSEGKTTKISAERLNHMDNQIFNNANAIGNVEKIADIGDGTLCGAAETLKETAEKLNQSLVDMDTALQGVKNFHFRYQKDISIQGNGNWPVNAFLGFQDIPTNKIAYVGISMSAYSGTRPDVLWNTYNNSNKIIIQNNSGYVHWNMFVLYTD